MGLKYIKYEYSSLLQASLVMEKIHSVVISSSFVNLSSDEAYVQSTVIYVYILILLKQTSIRTSFAVPPLLLVKSMQAEFVPYLQRKTLHSLLYMWNHRNALPNFVIKKLGESGNIFD